MCYYSIVKSIYTKYRSTHFLHYNRIEERISPTRTEDAKRFRYIVPCRVLMHKNSKCSELRCT